MQYKIPVAVIAALAVAILVGTPGILVSSQIAFGIAGGTNPGTSSAHFTVTMC